MNHEGGACDLQPRTRACRSYTITLLWIQKLALYETRKYFQYTVVGIYSPKKVKLTLCLIKHYAMSEWMYRSTVFLISTLVGGEWSASRPCCFTYRGKSPRYSLDRMLGGPQGRSGRFAEVKILDPTGTRTPTPRSSSLQPVAMPTALQAAHIYSPSRHN
jgi:hypothetical protein